MSTNRPVYRLLGSLLAGILGFVGIAVVLPTAAHAEDPPVLPETVSADALPTWQINGVVWSEIIVGTTVYVTGSFTEARPPGVPVGHASSIPAKNIFAFDVRTGEPVPFPHELNGQGLVVRADAAGKVLYVGGDFTMVDGKPRGHVAAFDLASGTLMETFKPNVGGQVRGIAPTDSTVYVGGNFQSANGSARYLLAAFATANGAMTEWAPNAAGGYVWALVLSPDKNRVIAGGSFTTINGQEAYGMGSMDAATGANLPWKASERIRTAGQSGAITSLRTDGNKIYGTGYAFGWGASFEGAFAADPYTGEPAWVQDCLGDTYDIMPMDKVAYSVSHAHDCSVIGGFPDTIPRRRWMKTVAVTDFGVGTIQKRDAYGWDFTGFQHPGMLTWFPELTFGTYTEHRQAAWSIVGDGNYLVLGGEFPAVNGVAQQGLVRFAKRAIAPNKIGPVYTPGLTPKLASPAAGVVQVSFSTVPDKDDATLEYDVFRSDNKKVGTITETGSFWESVPMVFSDVGLDAGTKVRYQVRARDKSGNAQWSTWSEWLTVPDLPRSEYGSRIAALGAANHWRLNESFGPVADSIGGNNGTNRGYSVATRGALKNESSSGISASSWSDARITTSKRLDPGKALTLEAWAQTTSSSGGRIIGFGDQSTGSSSKYDRVLYLDDSGRPNFMIDDGQVRTVTGGTPINDGSWHHIAATVDNSGMQIFVDGVRVARDQRYTNPASYNGYWRIGSDDTSRLENAPWAKYLSGNIDEVAVYRKALSIEDLQKTWETSGRPSVAPMPPTDAYGLAVKADRPDLFWRFDSVLDSVVDASGSGQRGMVPQGGVKTTIDAVGPGNAATFDGQTGLVVAQQPWAAPSTYSAELWFETTTKSGGKLLGFGNATRGFSTAYDRHIYMRDTGQLFFGTNAGVTNNIVTPGSYNDGQWHHVVATQGAEGTRLWVDGKLAGSTDIQGAEAYTGYWRVGGDYTWGGASSEYFAGTLDEVAVYPIALSEESVRKHYSLGGINPTNKAPVAVFNLTNDGLKVAVDGSASTDPDGSIASYAWDFGDGSTGSGARADHVYAAAGTYTVKLTVTDNQGATGSTTHDVSVDAGNKAPVAVFNLTNDGLKVAVDGSASTDPDGSIASYAWDFGDGSTGSGARADHVYAAAGTYTVKLTVTDNQGATSSTNQVVTVDAGNKAPLAVFNFTNDGLKIAVDGSSSTDLDGTVVSYAWDFGDGSTGSGARADHVYAAAGAYTVKLAVTDNKGAVGSTNQVVTVDAGNKVPIANFAVTNDGLKIAVDGSASTDPDGPITSYAWEFGDKSTGSGVRADHTYAAAGTYTVKLTVTDNRGASGSIVREVTVGQNPVPPLAKDEFTRTVNGGWGKADVGGRWRFDRFPVLGSVSDGMANMTVTPGGGYVVSLDGLRTDSASTRLAFSIDRAPRGGTQYLSVIGRSVAWNGDYRLKLGLNSSGRMTAYLVAQIGGREKVLNSFDLRGMRYQPGEMVNVRLDVVGTGRTALNAKIWKANETEPTDWTISASDSTWGLQQPGTVGVHGYATRSVRNGAAVFKFDNLVVTPGN